MRSEYELFYKIYGSEGIVMQNSSILGIRYLQNASRLDHAHWYTTSRILIGKYPDHLYIKCNLEILIHW